MHCAASVLHIKTNEAWDHETKDGTMSQGEGRPSEPGGDVGVSYVTDA